MQIDGLDEYIHVYFEYILFVYYSDETEARHCRTLDTYGDLGEREDGRWLLAPRQGPKRSLGVPYLGSVP